MSDASDASSQPQPLLQRRNLGDDVYRILWSRIIARDLHPGEKLSDLKLSSELGVSRTPVREALHRLLQDGVIEAQPNRGFFVKSFSAKDIDEIFEIRAALEALAMRAMVTCHPHEDYEWALNQLDEVEELIAHARSEADIIRANERFLEIDQGFHTFLVEQSGNDRLMSLINGIWAQIAVFQKAGTYVPGYIEVALRQHREVITHLLEERHDSAVEALQLHIRDMKARVIADLADTDAQ
jgi:DNA-binding GntR family transcriptional regulator